MVIVGVGRDVPKRAKEKRLETREGRGDYIGVETQGNVAILADVGLGVL